MRLLGEVFEGHRAQHSCSPQHTPGLVPFWEAATSMTRRAGALAAKGRPKGARLRLAGCLSRAARGALTVQAVLATPLAMLLVHSDLEGGQVQLGIPVNLLLPTRAQHACWAARPGACFRARLQQQATSNWSLQHSLSPPGSACIACSRAGVRTPRSRCTAQSLMEAAIARALQQTEAAARPGAPRGKSSLLHVHQSLEAKS